MSESYLVSPTIITGSQSREAVTSRGLLVGTARAIDFIAEAHFYLEVLASSLCRKGPTGWNRLLASLENFSHVGRQTEVPRGPPS